MFNGLLYFKPVPLVWASTVFFFPLRATIFQYLYLLYNVTLNIVTVLRSFVRMYNVEMDRSYLVITLLVIADALSRKPREMREAQNDDSELSDYVAAYVDVVFALLDVTFSLEDWYQYTLSPRRRHLFCIHDAVEQFT